MNQAASEKAFKGLGMEGFTARWYASLTHKSLDEFKTLARRIAAEIALESRVLEVAPGPGYFAIELAKLGAHRITGLDIGKTFVEIARRNAVQQGVRVDFQQGNAANMPFADESFDFLLCRAAFKNFAQPVRALREMYRVLKPGGRALIIDLRGDASKQSVKAAIEKMGLGKIDKLITQLTFRCMLLKRAYNREQFECFLSQTNFGPGVIKEDQVSLELWLRRPRAA